MIKQFRVQRMKVHTGTQPPAFEQEKRKNNDNKQMKAQPPPLKKKQQITQKNPAGRPLF